MMQMTLRAFGALMLAGSAAAQAPPPRASFEEAFVAANQEWSIGFGSAWAGEEALSTNKSQPDPAACRILIDAFAREQKAAAMLAALPPRPAASPVSEGVVAQALQAPSRMKRTEKMCDLACGTP